VTKRSEERRLGKYPGRAKPLSRNTMSATGTQTTDHAGILTSTCGNDGKTGTSTRDMPTIL